MPDKRFDTRVPEGKHRVRPHTRKTASGRWTMVREFMRRNPGGWSDMDFHTVTVPDMPMPAEGEIDERFVTFADRQALATEVLNGGWCTGRVITEELDQVGDMPIRGLRVRVLFAPETGKFYKDTIADFMQEELELKVFGSGNVETVDVDRAVKDRLIVTYWISNEEV